MGKRVDYRNNSKLRKRIKMTLIIVGLIFIIYIIVRSIINAYDSIPIDIENTNEVHYSVKDYKNLASLLVKYKCTYLRELTQNNIKNIYVNFDRDLYTGETSNENYFIKLLQLIAEYENFNDFKIIDSNRNIEIEVLCEDTNLVQITINGEKDYFLNHDSEINSKKRRIEGKNFTIQSKELQQLIDNDWSDIGLDFGSKDSMCENYNIFFDEGFKYKKVGRKVFNLIFTQKYQGQVAGGLSVSSTKEEIISALGEPTFNQTENLYGYLGTNSYLFFDFLNNQISVYPRVKLTDEEKFKELLEKVSSDKDIKTFAEELIKLWNDFDIYDYDSNYVNLQYTLYGVKLQVSTSSLKNGVFLYQNYEGDRNIDSLNNVYIAEDDLVYETEEERGRDIILKKSIQGEVSEEEMIELGKKFSVFSREKLATGEYGYKGLTFYSRDEDYPDTELDRTLVVSSYKWYDEYNFIYSVNNDGIYVFNPVTNEKNKLIDVKDDIIINEAKNGKIVYNDTEEIDVNMN